MAPENFRGHFFGPNFQGIQSVCLPRRQPLGLGDFKSQISDFKFEISDQISNSHPGRARTALGGNGE
jgi:hypothetical protein